MAVFGEVPQTEVDQIHCSFGSLTSAENDGQFDKRFAIILLAQHASTTGSLFTWWFRNEGSTLQLKKDYVFAKEWKWVQIVTKTQCLKKTLPSGVSPPWDSPAISLLLLSSNWLVPLPILPQWKWTKPLRKGRLLWNVPSKDWNEISMP